MGGGSRTDSKTLGAIDVSVPVSDKPARIALNFSNPYAFRAARLIGVFDALACRHLSARHVGLIGRDESEKTLHLGRPVGSGAPCRSPVGYRLLGVTRDDVVQKRGGQAIRARGSDGSSRTTCCVVFGVHPMRRQS